MLEQFGLSKYENKVYLTLLKMGISDARSISKSSEVPYGRIYDTLDSLKNRNVINEISGRPKRYTVVEPEIAIQTLVESKQLELKYLEKQAVITSQELEKQYRRIDSDELVWKVAIGDDLYQTYFDLLSETRREFLSYFEFNEHSLAEPGYFDEYRILLDKLNERKANVKLILGIEDPSIFEILLRNTPEMFTLLSPENVRYTTTKHVGFSIIDSEKVLLKVSNPIHRQKLLAGIYLKQDSMAKTMKESFLDLWEESHPIELQLKLVKS